MTRSTKYGGQAYPRSYRHFTPFPAPTGYDAAHVVDMHPALLIDEVLQLIFDFCADISDTEPKWTYAQLARCCRAWKDPALDRLWDRLNGVGPLLALVAKQDEDGDKVRCRILVHRACSHAERRMLWERRCQDTPSWYSEELGNPICCESTCMLIVNLS